MSTARRLHYSYEDYLSLLAMSDIKLEYCEGTIYAMAGGTAAHAELAANTIAAIKRSMPGCSVFSSNLKVRIEKTDLSTFPDVSLICGERVFSRLDPNALTNPVLLVEVTSPSTEDDDRGDKLSHYKQLPSLEAVLFVSHRSPRITVVRRSTEGWEESDLRAGERVVLRAPMLTLAVDEVYAGVALQG